MQETRANALLVAVAVHVTYGTVDDLHETTTELLDYLMFRVFLVVLVCVLAKRQQALARRFDHFVCDEIEGLSSK